MSFIYLASPYSHMDRRVELDRYVAAEDAAAWLLQRRIWVYSPIVHCHHLAMHHELPKTADYWLQYNYAMLSKADSFWILAIDGWQESTGVNGELDRAFKLGLKQYFIRPHGAGYIHDPLPKFEEHDVRERVHAGGLQNELDLWPIREPAQSTVRGDGTES